MQANSELQIEMVAVEDLHPNPANPRRHNQAVEKVAESIQQFGFRVPIVVSKRDNQIEAGHARWLAAKKLGLQQVPVLFFDDDPVVAAAFNIADNRARDFSEWDDDSLASLLVSLQAEDALLGTGFTDGDLRELLDLVTEPTEETFDVAEALESQIEPRIRRGEMWQLGRHRLMCGDSTDAEDVTRVLDGQQIRVMVTDPPYGVNLAKSFRWKPTIKMTTREPILGDERADWEAAWHLWPAQIAYVWHASLQAGIVRQGLENAGYEVRQQLIWVKLHAVLSPAAYHWRHEGIWYCVRKGETANWLGDKAQTTVWEMRSPIAPTNPNVLPDEDNFETRHPNQKPLEAFEKCIRHHASLEDIVSDPFVGTGTAIIAAERTKRRCVAMDIDPKWCEVAIQRWEHYTGEKAVRVG